jgi:uncharacterized protein YgiM (DUF1202 family)
MLRQNPIQRKLQPDTIFWLLYPQLSGGLAMRRGYMKAFMIFWISLTLVAIPLHSATAAPMTAGEKMSAAQTGPYVIANGAVYVRGGPGTGFWILGTLYQGETIPVLNISPDGAWWYVNSRYGEGWVAQVGVTAYNTLAVTVYDPGAIGTVTAGVLHVRYGAGEFATSLGQISQGQQVYVLVQDSTGAWLQIRWAYGTGWVAAQYMSVVGAPVIVDQGGGMSNDLPLTTDTPYAIVMATYLNIRSGPGINYAVLGQAYASETLPIIGRTNDQRWYQVETRFGDGWVYAAYVVTRNEYGGTPVTTAETTAAVAGPVGIVNTGALNLRSGPGMQYTSLGTLAGGAQGQIVGRSADWSWWLLNTPIGTGWANAIYILVRGDTSTVSYVAPGTTVEPSTGVAGGTAPEPAVTGPMAFVSTGALNIRSGPNSVFASLGTVYAGTRMPIIGQSVDRGWWYVESPFGNGYVSKLYVIAEGDTSSVPVVQ